MLNMLNWQSLEQRRNQAKSIMFYKIINNIVSVNSHQYLQPSVAITRGHHLRFIQLQTRVDVYLHSFLVVVIRPVPDGKFSTLFVRFDHVIPGYDKGYCIKRLYGLVALWPYVIWISWHLQDFDFYRRTALFLYSKC